MPRFLSASIYKATTVTHQVDFLTEGTWTFDVILGVANCVRLFFDRYNDSENLLGQSQFTYYLAIITNGITSGTKWILPETDIKNKPVTYTNPLSGFVLVKAYQSSYHLLGLYEPEDGIDSTQHLHITITRDLKNSFKVYVNNVNRITATDTATTNDWIIYQNEIYNVTDKQSLFEVGFLSFGGGAKVDNISVSNVVSPPHSGSIPGFSGQVMVFLLMLTVVWIRIKRKR